MGTCTRCEREFPMDILSFMVVVEKGRMRQDLMCGICALTESNKAHGLKRTKFDGPRAEANRLGAIKWLKKISKKI